MKQINNSFKPYYYLDEQGNVYNANTNKYLKQHNHKYYLRTLDNKNKWITLKDLYKIVYDKNYCIDNIELLDNEIFKPIPNTDDLYFISNYGRVKSFKEYEAIILKPALKKYYRLQIIQNNCLVNKFIHRLVAEAFLEPPVNNNYQLHHKDFNRLNNNANNLIWLSQKEHLNLHAKHKQEENQKEK